MNVLCLVILAMVNLDCTKSRVNYRNNYSIKNQIKATLYDRNIGKRVYWDSTDFLSHRLFPENKSNLTESENNDIINGLNNIDHVIKFIDEKLFDNLCVLLSGIVESIFSVSSSTVSTTFLYQGVSTQEIELFTNAFMKLNEKINKWIEEYNNIRYVIDWNYFKINFAELETSIFTLRDRISGFSRVTEDEKEWSAKTLLHFYDVDYKSTGDRLYSLMINIDQNYTENLFRASQKFTNFHRIQVQEFMGNVVKLLVQAIQIEATYINLKYENQSVSEIRKSLWVKRISELTIKIKTINYETKEQYKIQYEIDLDEYLATRESLNNEQFSAVIYNFLSNKYYWRNWFVLVYAPISGFKNHAVVTCQGTIRFRKNGRNIIVSSIDKLNEISALSHIERNRQIIGSYTAWKSDSEYSRGWVMHFGTLIPSCEEADTRASVAWGSNVWYMNSNLVVYKKNCVNDKSPCYNTFLFA